MSLLRKYGESLLDQPIGIEESRVRQERDAENRGSFQNASRYRRVARRGYREAMRNKDFDGAAKMLDWLEEKHGDTLGSNIGLAGVRRNEAAFQAGGNGAYGSFNGTDVSGQQQVAPGTVPGQPTTAGGAATGEALDQRLGLFSRMKDSMSRGDDARDYWDEAKGMGITAAGFGNAMERGFTEIGTPPGPGIKGTNTPIPLNMDTPSNPNSSDFNERAAAQGEATTPFDRHNLA